MMSRLINRFTINNYLVLGSIIALGTIDLAVGFVVTIFFLISQFRISRSPSHKLLALLLVLKILLILGIHFGFRSSGFFSVFRLLSTDFLFLLLLFLKIDKNQVANILKPILILFLLDFVVNISAMINGVDLLGNLSAMRPGDLIPRLNGILGHPFATVAIAVTGIFSGLILQKKGLTIIGFLALIINGTYRAPLTAILIVSFWVLLRLRFKFGALVFFAFCFSSLVFLVTYWSALNTGYLDGDSTGFISGNSLRVHAWVNAIEQIMSNPWIGKHTFLSEYGDMSPSLITDSGIAEAPWLQFALDYGILVALIDFSIMFFLAKATIRKMHESKNNNFYFVGALLTIVIFTEKFYGVLYGSMVFTPFCLIVIASILGDKRISKSPITKGKLSADKNSRN